MRIIDLPNWDPNQRIAGPDENVDLIVLPKPTRHEKVVSGFWLENHLKPHLKRPGGRIVTVEYERKNR